MNNNKNWYRSLTIISQVVIMVLIALTIWMVIAIPPLDYDFTTEELCDWAYATSRNQRILILQMLIVSCALVGIYGRKRARMGIGKHEK
ncbi:hypothetical protein LCGC14_1344000 [marine sediment metagenome]|uniref:Uncharacterized protein n=1 Tax=marine sediment metagenome TaxID=412755 RepID=A0A0F9MTR1_9ZZZZ